MSEGDDSTPHSAEDFNFKKAKESFKESDAVSAENFARQLKFCDQGDAQPAKSEFSLDEKQIEIKDRGSKGELKDGLRHIRQYNILIDESETAKLDDAENPWDLGSKSKVSYSRVSPEPNPEKTKREDYSGEDCRPHELSGGIRPQLAEDFSDLGEEAQIFKRKVVSTQNSAKHKEQKNGDRPRTFGEQLKSFPKEKSEEIQSQTIYSGFGRQPFVRDRLSECTRPRKELPKDDDEDEEEKPRMNSPDFPARQFWPKDSDAKLPSQQELGAGLEDEVMHQFTFKDQNTSPFKAVVDEDGLIARPSDRSSTFV